MTGPGPDRFLYRRRHRLTRATEYQAAYCDGCRQSTGPLTIYLRPNGLPEHRLGLSVGRRVGAATARNRIKRRLREAFRLDRSGYPAVGGRAFDLVVQVRPHRALPLDSYRRTLAGLIARAIGSLARQEPRDAAP